MQVVTLRLFSGVWLKSRIFGKFSFVMLMVRFCDVSVGRSGM
jgi:hypothetical protein